MKDRNPVKVSSLGRLCLLGEHSDWAAEYGLHAGFCIVVGTDQGMVATIRQHEQFIVETPLLNDSGRFSGRTRRMSCVWEPGTLISTAKDQTEFFRYCAGVAYEIQTRFNIPSSVEIHIDQMDLPLKKGVSSSAAVCILVAKAFDAAFDLRLFPHELMELAYAGERLTGSQCGRMDQACMSSSQFMCHSVNLKP